jgi:hypothetical protein
MKTDITTIPVPWKVRDSAVRRTAGEEHRTQLHFTNPPFLFGATAEANGLSAIYWAVFMQILFTLYKIQNRKKKTAISKA